MKFTDLDTTDTRNKLIKIDLDNHNLVIGSKVISLKGQWIEVLPTDSEVFTKAKLELQRKAVSGIDFDANELIATLIVSWSFEEECNTENRLKALKIWPNKLIDQIDAVASKEINFTISKPKN